MKSERRQFFLLMKFTACKRESVINLKASAKNARRMLGQTRIKLLRRVGLWKGDDWNSSLPTEVQHAEKVFKGEWRKIDPAAWRDARDPNLELHEELKALIPAPAGSVVRILDVGSGPLTQVGRRWDGRQLELVAVDPLAEQYNALMHKYSIVPPVPVTFAHGEKLLEKFAPDSFDLVHASNSLDHTYDPVATIGQMLAVVKPHHWVYLWHVANEGLREHYQGLHQWNFDIHGNDFIVNDGRQTHSITAAYKAKAEMTCEFRVQHGLKFVVAKFKKLGSSGGTQAIPDRN
jgi:hypothetical protein